MHICRPGLKYLSIFILTVAVAATLLVLSAFIPQNVIKDNVAESAEFLCDGELFGEKVKGIGSSKIDRYADSILLGIAYQYDCGHPIESVMKSAYYHLDYQNENDNLYDAVTKDLGANTQYMRYWHGSIAFVRPLLAIFNIQQIYVLNAIVILVLIVALLVILIRNRAFWPAAAISAGLILTSSWYVPMSLEYTWTYMIMLAASVIAVSMTFRDRLKDIGIFFMITGMITSYMDFLTTETLTLLIPVLLITWIKIRKNGRFELKDIIKPVVFWGIGYAGMWLMKWGLAAVVLRENVMPFVTEHISERLGGDIGVTAGEFLIGAVTRNIRHIFPWEYGALGITGGIAIILAAAYICYVYRRKNINWRNVAVYAVLAVIPYIRYIILHNHSYLHSFFTYRAQMASITALVMIIGETAAIQRRK